MLGWPGVLPTAANRRCSPFPARLSSQLDDYERHVIAGEDETMTIALTVPAEAQPGGQLKVRMVDGSEYNVPIPAGVAPGHKFLAVFPTAPMRYAAAQRLGLAVPPPETPLDDFLSAVDDGEEMAAAMAASAAEEQRRQSALEAEEDKQLKAALAASLS